MYLNLRQERQKRHWTQEYVANKVGISKTAINYLETAQCKPSYEVLVKLEDLFHKNHRQLFAVADEKPISQENNTINQK